MRKKMFTLLGILCICVLSACDMAHITNNNTEGTSEEKQYNYREMYLNNDSMDLTDKDLEVFNEASRVYSLYVESCETEYEKVVAAHDYIVKNCVYNTEAIEQDTLVDDDFHAYGVFVKGSAVCEGYAKAFKLLMDIAGIDCIMVSGNVGENHIPHAWNMIKLENAWYHVDVTYDDPNPETTEIVYLYLNVSDSIIEKDHSWNKNVTPEATSDKYEYIKNNGTLVNRADEITELIGQCNENKIGYVSFIWTDKDAISDEIWKNSIKGTNITNLSYSCIGVSGRRMYMVTLVY